MGNGDDCIMELMVKMVLILKKMVVLLAVLMAMILAAVIVMVYWLLTKWCQLIINKIPEERVIMFKGLNF